MKVQNSRINTKEAAKEKAQKLLDYFKEIVPCPKEKNEDGIEGYDIWEWEHICRKCAIKVVDEIIEAEELLDCMSIYGDYYRWDFVKEELTI
jgi:hypothetical protein